VEQLESLQDMFAAVYFSDIGSGKLDIGQYLHMFFGILVNALLHLSTHSTNR
jgi:hypothetical protein